MCKRSARIYASALTRKVEDDESLVDAKVMMVSVDVISLGEINSDNTFLDMDMFPSII